MKPPGTNPAATLAGARDVSSVAADAVADFLFEEARLLDEHDYDGWLALWHEDGEYWIPADGDDTDRHRHVSFVYDNRRRLGMRVAQLQTGYRYAQLPQSRTQHYITNVQIVAADAEACEVRSSYLVIEARFDEVHYWPGRAIHELVADGDGSFRIRLKKIVFINNDQAVTSMAFLP